MGLCTDRNSIVGDQSSPSILPNEIRQPVGVDNIFKKVPKQPLGLYNVTPKLSKGLLKEKLLMHQKIQRV